MVMTRRESVIETLLETFKGIEFPGDQFLQGSFEGCEPYDEIAAFKGKKDWRALDSAMLDAHYSALSFFSEAAFRFFFPAYLIADLRGELRTADPLFHLTGGFSVTSIDAPAGSPVTTLNTGGSTLLNPRRYGAIISADYARYRLSVFTREEARAIVAYLEYKRENDDHGINAPRIDAALNAFWLDRAANGPAQMDLRAHLRAESEFIAHLRRKSENKT
jgi:hypothetical protein